MFKDLYPDTEKELEFSDYRPLPNLDKLSFTDIAALTENLYDAAGNACAYGSALLEIALCDDIEKVNRKRFENYLRTVSSGHIAAIIGSTKYSDIDKALLAAWKFYNDAESVDFLDWKLGNETIEKIIQEQYQQQSAPESV